MCRLSTAARPSFRSISRRINTPPFDDSFPPSNVALIVFPPTGDRPGRNSVASVMVSGLPVGHVRSCFDNRIIREPAGLVSAHLPKTHAAPGDVLPDSVGQSPIVWFLYGAGR